jgi:RNase P subunit RPR2
MTPQHVVRFDLNEIPALEVRCKCGAVISLPLTAPTSLRERLACAGCNETLWQGRMEDDRVFHHLQNLVSAISMWKELEPKQKFSVGFSLVGSSPIT